MNDKSKRSPSGVSQPDSPRDAAVISLLNSDDESPVVAVTKKAKMNWLHSNDTAKKKLRNNERDDGSGSLSHVLVVGEPSSSAVQFVVEGEPYPQPRARFISGRVKRLYDPSQGKKQALKNQLLVALQEVPVFHRGVPLIAEFRFEMSRPAYHFRSDGTIKPGIPSHCMVPPDIDNLCKYVLDVMKGVIFEDDAQVVSLQAEMPYCHSTGCNSDPRTCVKISAKAD